MIDALLFAVRDAIRNAGFGYDMRTCQIVPPPGMPPPRSGDIFVAVHEGSSRSTALNYLDEMFAFSVTLTQRVTISPDRVGEQLLAKELARRPFPNPVSPSFNARCELLRAFLHMNWGILQDANTNLVNWLPDENAVYGFCEPDSYKGMDVPSFVGGEWFSAAPDADDMGIKAELRFDDCRRFQAIATYA